MDNFDFDYHVVKTQWPDNAEKMQFGNSYMFTSKPRGPAQRLFILTFPGMKRYLNSDGSMDATTNPKLNYTRLENFYAAHQCWASFNYSHPVYGTLVVKFAKPLADPDPIPEGDGALGAFEIQLLEQPV